MAQEHLKDDRDVEQILKLAVNKAGFSDEEALRQRLNAAAQELGLSEAQVRAAEQEYARRKEDETIEAEYRAELTREFWEHAWSYIIVNAGLIGFNLWQRGGIGWAFWPLVGWGIGLAFHAVSTFAKNTESYQTGFEEWKKKRQRKRKRALKRAQELEEEAASLRND